MKRARVMLDGEIHQAVADGNALRLGDGRQIECDAVTWLPPFEPGTIFAVGLNYADHARELSFVAQAEPLIFLKGRNSIGGHRAQSARPADVKFMHYECELAVVIGAIARRVRRDQALQFVRGYTVANDYVVRDYLENYYRPNLRAKSLDGCTLLGPWLVDATDIADPQQLALRTWVNGKCTQSGNTAQMIFGVRLLIEYLSSFMTLGPGDVILTGTPEGVVNVNPGDEVVTEVEGVGRLVNYIVERRPAGESRSQ